MIQLINGNSKIELKKIDSESVHSIVTDPPYEIGFMGKKWDNSGIANDVDLWIEAFRVLKPGGYLLAFGSPRTYHRMACAIEDAGFEIRDSIQWVYGSGFPKSLDIGKQIDKIQGNERKTVGIGSCGYQVSISKKRVAEGYRNNLTNSTNKTVITKGNSIYEGWGTALKPAHEPIVVARKPISEKNVSENMLIYGAGGINIEKSRVTENGRFPSNIIHDNSDEVVNCFPENSYKRDRALRKAGTVTDTIYKGGWKAINTKNYAENGSAARYFKSIIYEPKPSKKEKGEYNTHITVKPIKLIEYLVDMVTIENGVVLDLFMGSGTTGIACSNLGLSFIGIELEKESFEIAEKRIRDAQTLFSSVCH